MAADSAPPDRSPSNRRRTGMSVAQKTPLRNDAIATCTKASSPAQASAAIPADTTVMAAMDPASSILRFNRSAMAPTTGPHSASGSIHSSGMTDTSNGEFVVSKV